MRIVTWNLKHLLHDILWWIERIFAAKWYNFYFSVVEHNVHTRKILFFRDELICFEWKQEWNFRVILISSRSHHPFQLTVMWTKNILTRCCIFYLELSYYGLKKEVGGSKSKLFIFQIQIFAISLTNDFKT